jgi:hypothetical protein
MGVLPWPATAPYEAARRIFLEWLDQRGGIGSAEAIRALRQARKFVEQHGESRLTRWDAMPTDRPTSTVRAIGVTITDGIPIPCWPPPR